MVESKPYCIGIYCRRAVGAKNIAPLMMALPISVYGMCGKIFLSPELRMQK